MTALANPRPRKGTATEAADLLANVRALARPRQCEQCDRPARSRFSMLALCDEHAAEAMAVAYAMETGGAY